MSSDSFERLVESLKVPDVYDHPVSEVEMIETHISAVLLAGEYAYKIKKPVDFGFVDFTTLDKRRRFCEEELRLNRRFAPELYLEVVAIHGTPASPCLEPVGKPIEYAVKMKRFDQDSLLDRCIQRRGVVKVSMIEVFARDVAVVHSEADVAAPADGYGTPEVVTANVAECWVPIRQAGLLGGGGAYEDLVEYTEEQGKALESRFARRLREGHVRECHGDLHLGNLYLDDDRIRVFDCIEFNPSLRWIDVANDIAFCIMDLRFHGQHGFARRFRNAYLDVAGEYSALRVLRYYEIYRALVRAKVAALREREHEGTGLEDARTHLDLARRTMGGVPVTPLIITCGLSGSGKTWVSSQLVSGSDAIRIRSDVERGRQVDEEGERYTEAGIGRVYDRLLDEAMEIIEAGYPVIVDATFLKRGRREAFRRLAAALDVPFRILRCTAPEDELRRRIVERMAGSGDASEADLDVLALQIREQEPLTPEERAVSVEHDTDSEFSSRRLAVLLGLTVQALQ